MRPAASARMHAAWRSVLALALVAGCTQADVFFSAATDEGTVYECKTSNDTVFEFCYHDDAAGELGELIGAECGDPSRRWPWFANLFAIGCVYECPPRHQGCNAHDGCYCP